MSRQKKENPFAGGRFNFLKSEPTEVEEVEELEEPEEQLPSTTPEPEPLPEATRKPRARTGKRSNPNYEQVGVYIPRGTAERTRDKLYKLKSMDMSDLVNTLLLKWLDE